EQFAPPPGKQVEGSLAAAGFVAEVIRPATICIDRVKVGQQLARQEQRGNREILVMRAGQPGTVAPGSRQGHRFVVAAWPKTFQFAQKAVVHGRENLGLPAGRAVLFPGRSSSYIYSQAA